MLDATSILVVLPHDSLAEAAMDCATRLARRTGAALTLVDVIDAAPGDLGRRMSDLTGQRDAEIEQDVISHHRDRLAEFAERARRENIEVTEAVLQGRPAVEVVRMVLREGHDVLIKGASVSEDCGGVLAGVDMHLLRLCPCPVWVPTRATGGTSARILAAVAAADPGDAARAGLDRRVLDVAMALGQGDGAEVRVIHAWSLPGDHALRHGRYTVDKGGDVDALVAQEGQAAAARVAALLADYPQVARDHVVVAEGSPGAVIAAHAAAEGVDAIVMGTVGRAGQPGWVTGATAETILGRIPCSVIALKPEGFVSPVTLDGIG